MPNLAKYLALSIMMFSMLGELCAQDQQETNLIRSAVAKSSSCVVMLETVGGREKVDRTLIATAPFPGIALTTDGWVLTSAYHFAHDPSSILATTPSGKRVAAKLVARDRARQLVLLKIETEEIFTVPDIADSRQIRVGQTAIALGLAPNGEKQIAAGIVSALDRIYGRAIQFDARVHTKHYGGPLLDGTGRVIGIIAPLHPQSGNELAGAEWYDSGIGFAVPLDQWMPRFEKLKSGQDLVPGVLGVSLANGDPYLLPANVMVCQLNSPAYQAGVRVGDQIVEVDGHKIERQMQLRHALGPHYAGDRVHVTVSRKEERLEFEITLAERLEKYQYPMLGILPKRWGRSRGVVVRHVLSESPAEKAGIRENDRLVSADGKPIESVIALQVLLASSNMNTPLDIVIEREGKQQSVTIKLQPLTSKLPNTLPVETPLVAPEQGRPSAGLSTLKLPEEKNDCFVYVPPSYPADAKLGLFVWLPPPGQFDKAEVEKLWKIPSEKYGFIVLVPRPAEAGKWQRDEVNIVRKFIDQILAEQVIDRSRIAIFGREASGHMAWLTALSQRNVIRGVATFDAPLPDKTELINDPVNRLIVFSARRKESVLAKEIQAGELQLNRTGIPLFSHEVKSGNDFSDDDWGVLLRWFDTLDRL